MRVTNSMMMNTFKRNLSNNMRGMDKLQEQLSSNRRINRPSDDPVGITHSLRYRSNLVENDQYQKNVSDALSWMESTDGALNEAGNALQRARELAVKGANSPNDSEALKAIAMEVSQIREHLEAVANTEYAGRYIFSGTNTNTEAYLNGVWQGNTDKINYEISPNVTLPTNVIGADIFGVDGPVGSGTSVFDALKSLENDLLTDPADFSAISGRIGDMDKWINNNLTTRAEVGARINRLELAQSRLEDTNINYQTLLTKTEDIDAAEVITNLQMQENVYKAALSAGARIIQPTLVDFLR